MVLLVLLLLLLLLTILRHCSEHEKGFWMMMIIEDKGSWFLDCRLTSFIFVDDRCLRRPCADRRARIFVGIIRLNVRMAKGQKDKLDAVCFPPTLALE
jgi:hypothetical protein